MITEANASHILVKTKEEANLILELIKDGESFESLAKKFSLCPSKSNRGSLGWFSKGQVVKEFEEACFSGRINEILGPIKTEFGFHIIKINNQR